MELPCYLATREEPVKKRGFAWSGFDPGAALIQEYSRWKFGFWTGSMFPYQNSLQKGHIMHGIYFI
jgi:hypothetical protein